MVMNGWMDLGAGWIWVLNGRWEGLRVFVLSWENGESGGVLCEGEWGLSPALG